MQLANKTTGQIEEVPMHRYGVTENGEVIYMACDNHEIPEGFYLDEDGNWVKEN